MAKYKIEDMVNALKESKGMIYVAAERMGCSPVTIYNYAKRHEAVQEAIDSERGQVLDFAELTLFKAIQRGEPWAVSLFLKTVGKSRGYVEKIIIEGNLNITLINQTIAALESAGIDATEFFESARQRALLVKHQNANE